MKVAIIGSGPLGLEMALELDQLGAHVVWFSPNDQAGTTLEKLIGISPEISMGGTWNDVTTPLGRQLSALEKDMNEEALLVDYYHNYFKKLTESEGALRSRKQASVLRVQKRFLNPGQAIEGRSRLLDLFRVVYRLDPEKSIKNQVKENPEVFEKLGEDVLKSLSEQMEMYEDFDIVVDATGFFDKARPAGPSHGHAVNEQLVASRAPVFYGLNSFEQINELKDRSVAVIGTGMTSAFLTNKLLNQFDEGLSELIIITNEEAPFGKLKETHALGEQMQERLKNEYEQWMKRCESVQKDIHEWRGLPDFEKAKKPCPQIPEPHLKVLPGYNVTSVDQLLDQEGIFLTVESPEYREGDKLSLCTLKADKVFCATGYQTSTLGANQLEQDEPGFYRLGVLQKNCRYDLQDSLERVQSIKDNILGFFSRA